MNAAGQLSATATVSGSVTASRPTASIFHTTTNFISPGPCGSTCVLVAKPPAGKALVITSIHVDTYTATNVGVNKNFEFFRSSDGTCKVATYDQFEEFVNPGAIGEIVLPFEPGLPIQAGKALCVRNNGPGDIAAAVSAYGYSVAPAAVPAS